MRSLAERLSRPSVSAVGRRSRRGASVSLAPAADVLEPRMMLSGVGSELAHYGASGRLVTPLDAQGNRIADFSTAGYRNSEVALPDVAQVIDPSRWVSVSPTGGDDTASIQAAIDQVGAMSLDAGGFRGVVQLTAGEFRIADTIEILNSGVVLHGAGDGDDPNVDTILLGTDTRQYDLVHIGSTGGFPRGAGGTTQIVDEYVPVGASSFRVADPSGLAIGDDVIVRRPVTAAWIDALDMRQYGWSETSSQFRQDYLRTVTHIDGDRVFINAPVMHALDQQYGTSTIFKYTYAERIENVGVENIRGKSVFSGATDENHAASFIVIREAQDVWVRNITGQHFIYATVHAAGQSMRVTVDDAQSLDPVSQITGGRRYPFNIDGQFVLMRNLFSEEGRHDFVNNSSWRNRGPNVFLDAVAVNSHSSTGPHQRYSVGALYDTVVTDDMIEARNRGSFGTGHGWGGANYVFWNTQANEYIVQNPPTAQNWVIGGQGTIVDEDRFGTQPSGIYSGHGTPIDFQDAANPTNSLFVAQQNERLADPAAQRREYVVGDFDLVDFDGAGSVDDTADAAWAAAVAGLGGMPVEAMDQTTDGHLAALTIDYTLTPPEAVRSAILSLGLRGTGGDTTDDVIYFDDVNDARTLASLGLADPLSTTETTTLTIELTGPDLAMLQDGRLNLAVGEHTAVDWASLDLVVAPQTGDPPVIDRVSSSVRYVENRNPNYFARAARVFDADTTDFGGAVLTVGIDNGLPEDFVGLRDGGGVVSGTSTFGQGAGVVQIAVSGVGVFDVADAVYAGDAMTLTFRAGTTSQQVTQILRRAAYLSDSESPDTTPRSIAVSLTDPDGNTSAGGAGTESMLNIVSVADPTQFAGFDPAPSWTEGGGPAAFAPVGGLAVSDADTTDFGGSRLDVVVRTPRDAGDVFVFDHDAAANVSVSGTAAGSTVSVDGTAVATLVRGPIANRMVLDFLAGATAADVSLLASLITFDSTSDAPRGPKTVAFTMFGGDGARGAAIVSLGVVPVNDPPSIQNVGGRTAVVNAGDPPQRIATSFTIADPDYSGGGGTLAVAVAGAAPAGAAVSIAADPAGRVTVAGSTVSYNGTVVGTATGLGTASLTVSFNGSASFAAVRSVGRLVAFAAAGSATPGLYEIAWDFADEAGSAAPTETMTVDLRGGSSLAALLDGLMAVDADG